jgi:sialic acid synthase SpsE
LKPIKIGNKWVGEGHPCYIIAEIGSNFDGSIAKAKRLIKLAKECGADAAKFQSFITEELLSRKGFDKKSAFQKRWKKSVWEVYKSAELPREWHKELNQYAKKIGIHFFTSPWDFEAVDLLDKLNVPVIKVGSGDITHLDLLKYIGSKNRPIFLATGSSTLEEVKEAVREIKATGNDRIILMHAVVQYPSPIEEANLKVLHTLKEKFKLNVGYSDHSPGWLVALSSISLGSCVIEKHFTIDPRLPGPDHPHSMNPSSFKEMVRNIRLLEKALGDGIKKVQHSEKETRIIQRRGIWTTHKIRRGEKFSKNNIKPLRPVLGISASKYRSFIGKKAKRTYRIYEPLTSGDL